MNKAISFLFIITAFGACTNLSKTDSKNEDTLSARPMVKDSILMAYDPALDPWNVEAPFARRLGDTLGIKMYEVTLKPGDSVALHTHPDHTLYVVQGGKVSITTKNGDT